MTVFLRLLLLLTFCGSAAAQSFTTVYQPVHQIRKPDLRQLQVDWQSGRMMEILAEQLSRQFTLRTPLTLAVGECGQPNAFYVSAKKAIVLCLDLMPDLVDRLFREDGRRMDREAMNNTVAGALVFVVLHELGHALIDIQELPVLGREEDAADMISTFLILEEPALADRALSGGLWFFNRPKFLPNFFSQRHLSGEHSLNPQRAANLACWAYGKNPYRFEWALQAARVTSQRAARCAQEYAQMDRSVRELLRGVIR